VRKIYVYIQSAFLLARAS